MEFFRGEYNFSQSSGVRTKGKSPTGEGGGTDNKCNSPIWACVHILTHIVHSREKKVHCHTVKDVSII